jgi:acyl-CoA thioesterase I
MAGMKKTDLFISGSHQIMAAFIITLLLSTLGLSQAAFGQSPVQAAPSKPTWLIMGDSISAEYGLKRGTGWVTLLETRLKERQLSVQIQNASISGETTSGGITRLPALLVKHQPKLVLIELGGNDALRGLDLKSTESNLAAMINASRKIGAQVLLVGMKIPPNYGRTYSDQFEMMFKKLGTQPVGLVPFFFEGFGEDIQFFQGDRIHPTEAAQIRLLNTVWEPLLKTSGLRK